MSYSEIACEILECPPEEIGDCLFQSGKRGVLFPNEIRRLKQNPNVSFEVDCTIQVTQITIIFIVNGKRESLGQLRVRHFF